MSIFSYKAPPILFSMSSPYFIIIKALTLFLALRLKFILNIKYYAVWDRTKINVRLVGCFMVYIH